MINVWINLNLIFIKILLILVHFQGLSYVYFTLLVIFIVVLLFLFTLFLFLFLNLWILAFILYFILLFIFILRLSIRVLWFLLILWYRLVLIVLSWIILWVYRVIIDHTNYKVFSLHILLSSYYPFYSILLFRLPHLLSFLFFIIVESLVIRFWGFKFFWFGQESFGIIPFFLCIKRNSFRLIYFTAFLFFYVFSLLIWWLHYNLRWILMEMNLNTESRQFRTCRVSHGWINLIKI